MIVSGQVTKPGVQLSSAWTGKHQGYVHVSQGVYWEACYMLDADELRIQKALQDPSFEDTRKRLQSPSFKRQFFRRHRDFIPTEITHGR